MNYKDKREKGTCANDSLKDQPKEYKFIIVDDNVSEKVQSYLDSGWTIKKWEPLLITKSHNHSIHQYHGQMAFELVRTIDNNKQE